MTRLLVLAAWCGAACALAQPAPPAPSSAARTMAGDTVVYPRDAAYPTDLAARGVQGRAVVRASVDAEGGAAGVAIHESSRSPELDQAALALARTYRYAPARPGMGPAEVLVPIRFRKDTLTELRSKRCADFNVDKAWFTATFPERKVSEMEVVNMAVGALLFTLPGPQQMPYARNSGAIAAAAIAGCATRPDETFFGLMQQEAARLLPK